MTENNKGLTYRLGQAIAVVAVVTIAILFVLLCFGAIKTIFGLVF